MDRSGLPAFSYGSGVWIGLWVQGMDGAVHFDLQLQCGAPKIAFCWFKTKITRVYGSYNHRGAPHCIYIYIYISLYLLVQRPHSAADQGAALSMTNCAAAGCAANWPRGPPVLSRLYSWHRKGTKLGRSVINMVSNWLATIDITRTH